jgi:hypothetical protein
MRAVYILLLLVFAAAALVAPMVAVRADSILALAQRPDAPSGVVESLTDETPAYDAGNPDIQYHAAAEDIARSEIPTTGPTIWNTMSVSPPIFYTPFAGGNTGAPNFVPNYEDSVYMSRSSGQSQVSQFPYVPPPTDFCSSVAGDKRKTEESCNKLTAKTCASPECCVLLGGKKCVAGNQQGPLLRGNYIDSTIEKKDMYTHRGSCYGNC